MIQTPREFWKDKFGEYPQSDSDKLAVVIMRSYLEYVKETEEPLPTTGMTECYFTPNKKGTSATICDNCGKEKVLHTIGEGMKVIKTEYIFQSVQPKPQEQEIEEDDLEKRDSQQKCIIKKTDNEVLAEQKVTKPKPQEQEITHFHVNNNSDAFRSWLREKHIEFVSNGHYTSIPISVDIFSLGFQFGIYSLENNPKLIVLQ